MSPKARGLGLGKKLTQRSMDIAAKNGCEYYFAFVTGIFSQKIYRDLGSTVMKEVVYADYKDYKGDSALGDTGVHKTGQAVNIKLELKSQS